MLYIITGPAGVGKSTISEKVANLSKKSALVEGDIIYHMVCGGYVSPWKEGNHLKVFWDNCIDIIKNFIDEGYDVVFNYIIDNKSIDRLKNTFKDTKIKFVCLMVDEETIIKRDNLRQEDCRMGKRSLILLENFKKKNFSSKNILYTTNLSIDETVEEVINNDRFRI